MIKKNLSAFLFHADCADSGTTFTFLFHADLADGMDWVEEFFYPGPKG